MSKVSSNTTHEWHCDMKNHILGFNLCIHQSCYQPGTNYIASSPGSPIFSTYVWGGVGEGEAGIESHNHDKRQHDIMKDRQSTTVEFQVSPPTLVYQTQLFEAFKSPTCTTLA